VAYIGTSPTAGQYRKLDSISSSFNGSTTTFTMQVGGQNVSAGTPAQLLISLGGVIQQPTTDYTVSTSSLTFVTAPASGLSFFAILMGDALSVGTPADGTVSTAKLADAAVTTAKLADAGVTTAKLASGLTIDLTSGSVGSPSLTFDANTGLYSPAEDTIGFVEGGVEAARIDSSGRLLVGTSSARSFFGGSDIPGIQLEGTGNQGREISVTASNAGVSGGVVLLAKQRSGTVGGQTIVQSGDQLGYLGFQGSDGTKMLAAAAIEGFVDGTPGVNDLPTRLVFSTTPDGSSSPTERMTITNGGDFYFNTTVSTKTTSAFRVEEGGVPNVARGTAGSFMKFFHSGTGTQIGSITNVGGTATAFNTSSDYRLKENIQPVADGIVRLQQLKPSRFNFITNPDHAVDGFIAHEVQTVVPEAITGEKDAVNDDGSPVYQGIDQSKLVPLLTAALQEAIAKIETLEARLNALESA